MRLARWGKVVGLINTSISGTDGSNDGWGVVAAAVIGELMLFGWWKGRGRWLALGPLLAGIGAFLVTYSDRGNVTDIESGSETTLAHFQVGWGLNLAMGASVVLGVVGLVALLGSPDSPGMTASESKRLAPNPMTVTRECPHCKSAIRPDASVCPHCQRESEPWTLNDDVWWVKRDGQWLWFDSEENKWLAPDPEPAGPDDSTDSASTTE